MKDLTFPSKFERAPKTTAKPGRVDRSGGDFGAGLISRVSVITQGEALGHEAWIDATFNQQVADALNATKDVGIKSRFAHPSLSGDGTGTVLGRLKDARVEGDRVLADLHLLKSAHEAPDGNLAKYSMDLAEEDDKAFGLSIVFEHDEQAESDFYGQHLEAIEWTGPDGDKRTAKRFRSPDERNVQNYYHVRLKQLRAGDVVDDPAANPEGLFYRGQDLPAEANKVLAFALGVTTEKPPSMFGVDAERVKGFLTRSLAAHGFEITKKKEEPMSESTASAAAPPASTVETTLDPRAELLSEMAVYTEAFGAEKGVQWFQAGKPLVDCWKETAKANQEQLSAAKTEINDLQAKLSAARGEETPLKSSKERGPEKRQSITRIAGASAN